MTWLLLCAFYFGGAVGSAALSLMVGGLDLAFFRYEAPKPTLRKEIAATAVFALFWPLSILVGYLGVRQIRKGDHCSACGCTVSPPCACFERCGSGFHHVDKGHVSFYRDEEGNEDAEYLH